MRLLKLLILVCLSVMLSAGCAKEQGDAGAGSADSMPTLAELNDPKYNIAAVVGTASEPYVPQKFPRAKEKQFPSVSDMVIALEKKQVDAIVFTRSNLETVVAEKPGQFAILDENLGDTAIYMAISPHPQHPSLQKELNEFLREKKSDGTLAKAYTYWVKEHHTELPPLPQAEHPTKKLIIGTTGVMQPFSFYAGDNLVGFDIEMTTRFAAQYGYEIEYRVEDFTSMLTDVEFSKVDMAAGCVMYTEERAERLVFPETPLYTVPISAMVRQNDEASADGAESGVTDTSAVDKPADLNDAKFTIGVVTGSSTETFVPVFLPNAQLKQFSSVSEMILALEQKQVDAGAYDRPALETAVKERSGKFRILDEPILYKDVCMVISPRTNNENLENEVNEFLAKHEKDGSLSKMVKYWTEDNNTEMPDLPRPENPTKTLTVSAYGTIPPYNFYVGDKLVGLDIELIARFAYEYNYKLEFRIEELSAALMDVELGNVDMLCGGISYTKERAERIHYSKTPVFRVPASVIVRDDNKGEIGFADSVALSFEKTLLREDRYKMILSGLKVTLILSVGSILLGTVLGVVLCLMKRSRIKIIAQATTAFIALISGLPIVLTLMICFYIVFAGSGLGDISVAIVAFAIDFGCYVAITLNSGIDSVAKGEIEAGKAMGMSNFQVMRTVVLPQAVQNIFGVYRRQVISIIKATSIVGYIAVQDLTKVSDIIRARTYDAFFSLVFTAAIYFIIARICIFILDKAEHRLNRRKENATRSDFA